MRNNFHRLFLLKDDLKISVTGTLVAQYFMSENSMVNK